MQKDIILTVKKFHKENHVKFLDAECEPFIETEARLAFIINKDTISIHAEGDRTYILDKDVCLAIIDKVCRNGLPDGTTELPDTAEDLYQKMSRKDV